MDFLYHGTPCIYESIERKSETTKGGVYGDQIFATESEGYASTFLSPLSDDDMLRICIDDKQYVFLYDAEKFMSNNIGGRIWKFTKYGFENLPDSDEWVLKPDHDLKVVSFENHDSCVVAMLNFDVDIRYITKEEFEKISSSQNAIESAKEYLKGNLLEV